MAINDALGNRMKEYYESIPKTKLMRRCPVAVRLRRQSVPHLHTWLSEAF